MLLHLDGEGGKRYNDPAEFSVNLSGGAGLPATNMQEIKWLSQGGAVSVRDGVYTPDTQEDSYLFSEEKAPRDFCFSCEVKINKPGDCGVLFRAQGKNGIEWIAGYYFSFNADTHTVTLQNVNGGDHYKNELGRITCPFEYGKWYTVKVCMQDYNARLWFNNFEHEIPPYYTKFDLQLKHFPRGVIGLHFGEGVAEFRSVSLGENTEVFDLDPDKSYQNPIIYGADPDIMYHDGTYYLYYTDTQDMSLFQCYTSKDLVHWSEPHVVFHGCDGWGNNEYMSPNVIYYKGLFYMFYASHTAWDENHKRRVQVAYASSTSPLGPFKSKTCRPLHTDIQEIGGHPFVDEDGRVYLSVVRFNHGNEVWAYEVKLEDGVVTSVEETLTKLMVPDCDWERDYANIVEGAVIFKHNDLYYTVYAGSHYKGSYAEGLAWAKHPLGPYTKYEYNPILRKTAFTRGTGDSVYVRNARGEYIMFYHQHFSVTEISPRQICMDRMKFVKMDDGPDVLIVNGPTATPQPGLA